MQDKNRSIDYMPQLDSIRAIAVFLVIISHWLPKNDPINFFRNGVVGVDIFFVLSGFLITGILLKYKNSDSNVTQLKKFYIRRSFRIFPPYYFVLLISFAIGIENIGNRIEWYLLYLANIYFWKTSNWDTIFSHLWSLCVEEQFYFLWPFIILYTPKKYLKEVIYIFLLLGPSSRIIFHFLNPDFTSKVIATSTFDCFGFGAFLALNKYQGLQLLEKRLFKVFLFICMILFLFFSFIKLKGYWAILDKALFDTAVAFISMFLIHQASNGIKGTIGKFLESKILMTLGKISYGLYLYHLFIPYIYIKLLYNSSISHNLSFPFYNQFPFFPLLSPYLMFPIYFVFLLCIAGMSWKFLENPLNQLKNRFN